MSHKPEHDVYKVRFDMAPPEPQSTWGPIFWVAMLTFGLMAMC